MRGACDLQQELGIVGAGGMILAATSRFTAPLALSGIKTQTLALVHSNVTVYCSPDPTVSPKPFRTTLYMDLVAG